MHRGGPVAYPGEGGRPVKTDRRDAVILAKLHHAGDLTAVCVPNE